MSILVTRRGPIAPGCQRLLQALVLWLVPIASVLATERPVLEIRQAAWIEQGESVDLPPAPSQRGFGPVAEGEVFPLGPGRTLWLRVTVTGAHKQWLDVDIPVPLLDDVVLLQQDAGGTWSRQEA